MPPRTRIVVPFGFYGYGNIGDEATLHGFARLLAARGGTAGIAVASQSPSHTARVEPAFRYFRAGGTDVRRWWAKLRASAHVFAGGTPVSDVLGAWPLSDVVPLVKSAEARKAPVAFVGVGIEGLREARSRAVFVREIVPRVRHWSVRSSRDRQRLTEYGVAPDAVTVAADMAWLIEPAASDFGRERLARLGLDLRRPLVGVNLMNENHVLDRQPEMAAALAGAIDAVVEALDGQAVFLANEVRDDPTFDTAAAMRIMSLMTRKDRAVLLPADYLAPREMMSIIGCCALTMSMRYHFCLFSAKQQVPFIAILRSDKVADLCRDLGWDAAVVPGAFAAADVVGLGTRLTGARDAYVQQLRHATETMAERALRNVLALDALGGAHFRKAPQNATAP